MSVSPVSNLKSLMYSGISKGRAGFPRPLSSGGRIGLSAQSKQLSLTIVNSGAQMFSQISSLLETNNSSNQTAILALRSRLVRESVTLEGTKIDLSV